MLLKIALVMRDAMAALGVPAAITGYVSHLDPPPGNVRAALND